MANFFLPASILSCICPGSCSQQIECWSVASWWVFSILWMSWMDNEEHSLIWVSLHSAGNSQGPSVWTSFLVDSIAG
jgi:hypothetical protein